MKNIIDYFKIERANILLLSIFLQSLSFLTIKLSTIYNNYITLLLLVLTFCFLILRALTWQIVLKNNPISKVYPFNSLVQILIFLYAVVLFDENITFGNIAGLFFMITGIILLGKDND